MKNAEKVETFKGTKSDLNDEVLYDIIEDRRSNDSLLLLHRGGLARLYLKNKTVHNLLNYTGWK